MTMAGLRQIRHPGPVAPFRHAKAWGEAVALDFTIDPGETMEAGLGRGVAEAGCDAAYVAIAAACLAPFRRGTPYGHRAEDTMPARMPSLSFIIASPCCARNGKLE